MDDQQDRMAAQMPLLGYDEAECQRLLRLPAERGTAAVPELRSALAHPDPWVRLHAVEGLAQLKNADAQSALVFALHDPSFGVHWAASDVLARSGEAGVVAVLRALLHDTPTTTLLHGAAYVLHHAELSPRAQVAVAPVRDALGRPAADLEAPMAAIAALELLVPAAVTPAHRSELSARLQRARRGPHGELIPAAIDLQAGKLESTSTPG